MHAVLGALWGGGLISQAIHQIDLFLYLAGAVDEVFGYWQLGAMHKVESEDTISAVLHFASGTTGVVEAATAFWQGNAERIEIYGTQDIAITLGTN